MTTLRAALVGTAVAELASGDLVYGAFCASAVALTAVAMRRSSSLAPACELEILILGLMLADMTVGNLFHLYGTAWYDKVLHLGNSTLIGAVLLLSVEVRRATGIRLPVAVAGAVAVLVTLGLGALWEIAEYAVDELLGRASQGAPGLTRLDDTMMDLILDAAGGCIGAVLASVSLPLRPRPSPASALTVAAHEDDHDRSRSLPLPART